jgi:hypothetical protein
MGPYQRSTILGACETIYLPVSCDSGGTLPLIFWLIFFSPVVVLAPGWARRYQLSGASCHRSGTARTAGRPGTVADARLTSVLVDGPSVIIGFQAATTFRQSGSSPLTPALRCGPSLVVSLDDGAEINLATGNGTAAESAWSCGGTAAARESSCRRCVPASRLSFPSCRTSATERSSAGPGSPFKGFLEWAIAGHEPEAEPSKALDAAAIPLLAGRRQSAWPQRRPRSPCQTISHHCRIGIRCPEPLLESTTAVMATPSSG